MASAELGRRVGKVVGYPLSSEMSDLQHREFHEVLLEADTVERPAGQVAGGDPEGRAEPAEAPGRPPGPAWHMSDPTRDLS